MNGSNPARMTEWQAITLAQGRDYEWFQGFLPMTKWKNDPTTSYCCRPERFVHGAGEEHPSKCP